MHKKLIPFWEETYQKENVMTFSIEPNKTIKDFEYLITKQSNILEVGCGEGQNVLYLGKQGYCNIDAFDISESGISKLKRLCKINNLAINAFVQDLTSYEFEKKYDLIMSFATLCFVKKKRMEIVYQQSEAEYYSRRYPYNAYIYGYSTCFC